MDWPKFTKRLLLADGRINETEADLLRRAVLDDGVVDREEVEFLVELKREATSVHSKFDLFLFEVLEKVVLADGVITDAEAKWLRAMIFADNQVSPTEVGFLLRLKDKARSHGHAFQRLYDECTQLNGGDFSG